MPLAIGSLERAQPTDAESETDGAARSPRLSLGSRGDAVATLQGLLQRAGFNPRGVDAAFGPMTRAAVIRFQGTKGISQDGVVGPATWSALRTAVAAIAPPRADAPAPPRGRGLKTGDMGEQVISLQTLLTRAGFDPNGIDGEFGGGTRRAVTDFQRVYRLRPDGVVGEETWRALQAYATGAPSAFDRTEAIDSALGVTPQLRQAILEIARREIGTVERTNRNDGAVAKYPNYFGRDTEKYCADFTSWVFAQVGLTMNQAYTPTVVKQLQAKGLWKGLQNPLPGDLVLFDWDDDDVSDHIGVVEAVNADGTLTTIEGNTQNPNTGREGVWRRHRDRSTVLGFGTPY